MLADQVFTLLHRQLPAFPESINVDVVEDVQVGPVQRAHGVATSRLRAEQVSTSTPNM